MLPLMVIDYYVMLNSVTQEHLIAIKSRKYQLHKQIEY